MTKANLHCSDGVIYLSGDVKYVNAVQIYEQGKKLFDELSLVKVDLSQISSGDSSSLALLTSWVRFAKSINKEIIFINMPAFMKDVCRVSGLDYILPLKIT